MATFKKQTDNCTVNVVRANIEIDCLTFADVLAILTRDIGAAKKQNNFKNKLQRKSRSLYFFETTEYMICIKQAPKDCT